MSKRYALSAGAGDYRPARVRIAAWEQFVEGLRCLDQAAQDIARAGELFASIGEADWERIVDDERARPYRRTLEAARACGQGRLVPQLVTASGQYAARLRTFPVEDQARYLSEPVEVAVWHKGQQDSRHKFVSSLTPDEIRQVFKRNGSRSWEVRSLEDQWVWLEGEQKRLARKEETAAETAIDRPHRWAIRNGRAYLAARKYKSGLSLADVRQLCKDLS